ncbi:ComF family protein [Porticoccaceae bacterium]|nr:ComF family protein [Porticoccaceae bacterium]
MSVSFNSQLFFKIALKKIKHQLLPSRCSLCLEPLLLAQDLYCLNCETSLPYIDQACVRCSEPLPHSSTCPNCQKNPPYFSRCIALCDYQYPISTALKNIKQTLHAPETKKLSALLAKRLKRAYRAQTLPSIVIPIPAHPLKILRRGFNQSALIAHRLCCELSMTHLHQNVCYRTKLGKPQKSQNRAQRLKLLSDNFAVRNADLIEGKSLAIVDDIITTGATANALSKCRVQAGAKSVDLWCIAKTSWHNHSSSIKI